MALLVPPSIRRCKSTLQAAHRKRRVAVKVGFSAVARATAGISDLATPMSARIALSRLANAFLVVRSHLQTLTALAVR